MESKNGNAHHDQLIDVFRMNDTQRINWADVEDDQDQQEPNKRSQTTRRRVVGVPQYDTVVDKQALEIAQAFMKEFGYMARSFRNRKQLEGLYNLWLLTASASQFMYYKTEAGDKIYFKNVLFAMAHGMKVLRVKHRGQVLSWNQYRCHEGSQTDEAQVIVVSFVYVTNLYLVSLRR